MAISSDYPSPVRVNGFSCRNCTDVEYAKKNVDPAHPKSGPNNRDAVDDPSRRDTDPVKIAAARKAAEEGAGRLWRYGADGGEGLRPVPGMLLSIHA